MSERPVIGITTYVAAARWGPWEQTAALVPLAYADAVTRAGGRAVLLPPAPGTVEATLGAVAGLIMCGGPDLDPALTAHASVIVARATCRRAGGGTARAWCRPFLSL